MVNKVLYSPQSTTSRPTRPSRRFGSLLEPQALEVLTGSAPRRSSHTSQRSQLVDVQGAPLHVADRHLDCHGLLLWTAVSPRQPFPLAGSGEALAGVFGTGMHRQALLARTDLHRPRTLSHLEEGDADADGVGIAANSFTLNSGGIHDSAGNVAALAHSALPAEPAHKVSAGSDSETAEGPTAHDAGQEGPDNGVVGVAQ